MYSIAFLLKLALAQVNPLPGKEVPPAGLTRNNAGTGKFFDVDIIPQIILQPPTRNNHHI